MGTIASLLLTHGLKFLAGRILDKAASKGTFKKIAQKLGFGKEAKEEDVLEKLRHLSADEIKALIDLEYSLKLEEEVTKRLDIDNKADSYLTRHVRPYTLIFLMLTTVIWLFCVAFAPIDPNKLSTVEVLGQYLMMMNGGVLSFYFGGRSWEKIQSVVQTAKNKRLERMAVNLDEIPDI